ncbi:VacJ family lipoprotein [Pokkaliibacter plantistimulans]|uniref:MlaA family lipoprotein n=1 Tax=Pokkaliibacter plantistimulans TaxID=1635171 RepID=UPI00269AEBB5|nr:VacJ family lipoprotein [Pokkaliibacter plantistimulans]
MNYLSKLAFATALTVSSVSVWAEGASSAEPVNAHAQSLSNKDPLEGLNRAIFKFNDGLDTYILKPVAKGYHAVTPDIVESGVGNFFSNLGEISNIANNLLQFKIDAALQSFSRLVFNSTFGLAGLIDVATPMGIPEHEEDFGQTLGYWGLGSGPYLMLPVLGPSTLRDTAGLAFDYNLNPVNQIDDDKTRIGLGVLKVVNKRASLLDSERLIEGDKYLFIRNAYLQRRDYLIHDGNVTDQFDVDF